MLGGLQCAQRGPLTRKCVDISPVHIFVYLGTGADRVLVLNHYLREQPDGSQKPEAQSA